MKNGTEIVVYNEEEDASLVVELLNRNNFYLGKLDKKLNVERFLEFQHRRGQLFAVVAKYDGKAIGYIGGYLSGNQMVTKKYEVYLGTTLIDHSYQRFMPSIGKFYFFAMEELIKRGYRIAIADVFRTNMTSLYMLRRFGFLLTNSEPNIYDNFFLRNYIPAFFMAICAENIRDATEKYGTLFSVAPPIDKQEARDEDRIVDGKYVKQTFKISEKYYTFYMNIYSQYVCKISIKDYLKIDPLNKCMGYSLETFDNCSVEISVFNSMGGCVKSNYSLKKSEKVEIKLLENAERVLFKFNDLDMMLQLYPNMDMESSETFMLEVKNDIAFDSETGYLKYADGDKGILTEMWPCFSRPFLFGYLEPRKFNLKYSKTAENKFLLYEEKENYTLYREYTFEDKNVSIYSYADVREKTIVEPIFHVAFDNLDYSCTIITENETISKTFSKKDKSYCDEVLLHEYFGDEKYTESILKEIIVTFPNSKFRITSERDMYCFYQFNYIGFRFVRPSEVLDTKITAENERVDLGRIKIEYID